MYICIQFIYKHMYVSIMYVHVNVPLLRQWNNIIVDGSSPILRR